MQQQSGKPTMLQPGTVLKMDKALLARATSSEDHPTPGYMYGELAKMSLISYDACRELEDYLLGRLRKGNHNAKHKCLLIIRHLCRTGRADFKRDMQRQAEAVRECLQYRGPPDPLRGDSIYKRVHEAAKETLEAIYDSAPPTTGGPSAVAHRIQGFGSEPYPAPASGIEGVPGGLSISGSGGAGIAAITDMASSVVSAVTAKIAGAQGAGSASLTGGGGVGAIGVGGGGGYAGPGPAGGGPGGRYSGMQGLGNPAFQDPRRQEKSLLEKAGELVRSQIGTVVNSVNTAAGVGVVTHLGGGNPQRVTFAAPPDRSGFASAHPGNLSTSSQWNRGSPTPTHTPYQSGGAISPAPPTGSSISISDAGISSSDNNPLAPAAAPSTRQPGGVGGVWGTAAVLSSSSSASIAAAANAPSLPSAVASSSSSLPQQQVGRVGGAAKDGEYERHLILELCPPGGTRAVPPADKLAAFLQAARTLDVEMVGGIILDRLADEGEPWQVRAKALAVIEALVKHASSSSPSPGLDPALPREFHEFFVDNIGEIEAVAAASGAGQKAVVRDKAVKILSMLGHDTSAFGGASNGSTSTTSSRRATAATPLGRTASPAEARQASLLDLGDDDDAAAAAAPKTLPVTATANGHGNGNGQGHDLLTTPPPPPEQPRQQRRGAGVGTLLFSDVQVKGSKTSSPPPPPLPPTDLLAGMTLHNPNPPQQLSQSQSQSQSRQEQAAVATTPVRAKGEEGGEVDLLGGLAASPLTVQAADPLQAFDPLATSASASQQQQPQQPPPVQPLKANGQDLLSGASGMSPPPLPPPQPQQLQPLAMVPMGGGLGMQGQQQQQQQQLQPRPLAPGAAPPVDFAKMGQGMIPPLQPRTIIPSADEGIGTGAGSAFSFIGATSGSGGGGMPLPVAQPGMGGAPMMMGMLPTAVNGHALGALSSAAQQQLQQQQRQRQQLQQQQADEAAFSFVNDAMAKSR